MRVLIVEDYSDVLEALSMVFEKAGWEVFAAKDGRDGLRAYHNAIVNDEYFDLLILDIQMPRLNGIAVGVNVRNLEQFAGIPRATHVYLTGHDEELTIHGEELVAISFADAYIRNAVHHKRLIVSTVLGELVTGDDHGREAGRVCGPCSAFTCMRGQVRAVRVGKSIND